MASFEARIEGMTQITIEETGTTPTQGQLTQFLDEGIKDLTNKIITIKPEESFKFASESEDTSNSGTTITGIVLSVVREHNSASILRRASQISPDDRYEASNTDSLNYRSKYNPGWYLLNKKLYVVPVPGDASNNDAKVSQITYATTNFNQDAISNFPDEYEELVSLYTAAMSCNAAANSIHNNMPTAPTAPLSPDFSNPNIVLPELPMFALKTPIFDTRKSEQAIAREDLDIVDKYFELFDKEVESYTKKYDNEVKSYEAELEIFKADLEKLTKDADRETQVESAEYQGQLELYKNELQFFQIDLQEAAAQYKWYTSQYVTFMSQYNQGLGIKPKPPQQKENVQKRKESK